MWSHDVEMKMKGLRGGRTWIYILWRQTQPCSWMAWMEGSHCCHQTCSNVAANSRLLESLHILWGMCILTCFVDASDMANVCEPIYTSTVSTSDTIHTGSKNIWPCSLNTASISACPYMASILSMGRAQGCYYLPWLQPAKGWRDFTTDFHEASQIDQEQAQQEANYHHTQQMLASWNQSRRRRCTISMNLNPSSFKCS